MTVFTFIGNSNVGYPTIPGSKQNLNKKLSYCIDSTRHGYSRSLNVIRWTCQSTRHIWLPISTQ